MAEIGKYCKAYLVRDLLKFPDWLAGVAIANLRPETRVEEGREVEVRRDALKEDDILYIHEDFTVTDGIYLGEHVVYEAGGDDWKRFCEEVLAFTAGGLATAPTPRST